MTDRQQHIVVGAKWRVFGEVRRLSRIDGDCAWFEGSDTGFTLGVLHGSANVAPVDEPPAAELLERAAEAVYRADAPRYGNGVLPFAELGHWDKTRFRLYALAAWEIFHGAAKADSDGG